MREILRELTISLTTALDAIAAMTNEEAAYSISTNLDETQRRPQITINIYHCGPTPLEKADAHRPQ
jgi:hypothetical protein